MSPAAEARDRALLPGADASPKEPGADGDERAACRLVTGQGEDNAGGAEGCGQPDSGPGGGVLCARVLRGGLVRRLRLARRRSVRPVIRVVVCSGHGKPLLLMRAAARGVWVNRPWTEGELAAQVRWSCPVAPSNTDETAPRGEPIRVLANLPTAAVVPLQFGLFAVLIHGF